MLRQVNRVFWANAKLKCNKKILNNCYEKCTLNHRCFSIEPSSYLALSNKLALSIANSNIVSWSQTKLVLIHDVTGLPWWATLTIVTLSIRSLVTLPLSIYQQKILFKYESLRPEIEKIAQKLKKEVSTVAYAYNIGPTKAKLMFNFALKREVNKLVVRDNCHPFKASLVIWFQIPAWIILSYSIRNMIFMYPIADQHAQIVRSQFAHESALWFCDLTVPDPYFILPILLGVINLATIEVHARHRLESMKEKTTFFKVITNLGRGISIIMIPIASIMPTGISFYWCVSALFGLGQNILIKNKKVNEYLRLSFQKVKPD